MKVKNKDVKKVVRDYGLQQTKMDQASKLSNNQYSPYFASVNFELEKDTKEERMELTRKFILLPRAIRYGLLDNQTREDIKRLSSAFGVSDQKKAGEITRTVRDVFFDNVGTEEIKNRAQKVIGIETGRVDEFSKEIKRVTEKIQKRGEEEVAADTEQVPIIIALKKFEKLGGQEITEGYIQIEISDEVDSVEPSIRNWLEDYIQKKGAQAHNNLERSDYLYKSENTESLSTQERDKLALILRSYDLDELVSVSKSDQELLFENVPHENTQEKSEKKEEKGFFGKKIDLSQQKNTDELVTKEEDKIEENSASHEADDKQETFEKMMNGQGGLDGAQKKNKPHEITWYGKSSPFDNLEKIDADGLSGKQGTQERLESRSAINGQQTKKQNIDFGQTNNEQKTKHVVDLKAQG